MMTNFFIVLFAFVFVTAGYPGEGGRRGLPGEGYGVVAAGLAGRSEGSAPTVRQVQPTKRLAMMVALWPPKPKELLAMASIFIARAVCGT